MDTSMTGTGHPHGYWYHATPDYFPATPPLSGLAETDVVIVGAGLTGLSTALHCRELGLEVRVLEAVTPGSGASGRNAGQWLPGWVGKTPEQVEALQGGDGGGRLNRFNVAAARLVPALIDKYQLAADARATGVLQVAASPREFTRLTVLASQWQRCGAAVSVLDAAELRSHLCTEAYRGGVLFHDAGCLNPLAYTREMARTAARLGALIHCHSPVLALRQSGTHWEIATASATVRARRVVVATDAVVAPALAPELQRTYYRLAIPMLSSAVLSGGGRDVAPELTPFAEMRPSGLLFGGMFDVSGRWIVSTVPCFGRQDKDRVGAWIKGRFRRVFPHAPELQWESLWWGDVGLSRDLLPRVYELRAGAYAVNGYSGGGIALATAFGRSLAHMLAANDAGHLPMATLRPGSVPLRDFLPRVLGHGVFPLLRVLDRCFG